jgi:DNA replication protein DnaC
VQRDQKRLARRLSESGLTGSKTLNWLDGALLAATVRRQLPALIGGRFVNRAVNVLDIGQPGGGKTHLLPAPGRKLILQHFKRALFRPGFKLTELLAAKRDLGLENELKKLAPFAVLILDDIATRSKAARRWKCSSRCGPSAASGGAS